MFWYHYVGISHHCTGIHNCDTQDKHMLFNLSSLRSRIYTTPGSNICNQWHSPEKIKSSYPMKTMADTTYVYWTVCRYVFVIPIDSICFFIIHLCYHDINEIDTLHWRHNDHDGVSNHQPHSCLLNRLFRRKSKKTSKLRVTGLWVGNSPDRWIPHTKSQLRGKCFHLMTSSWHIYINSEDYWGQAIMFLSFQGHT